MCRVEVETHTLSKGLVQYVFRSVPTDKKSVDLELIHPERRLCLSVRLSVREGRECYRTLLSLGYRPW